MEQLNNPIRFTCFFKNTLGVGLTGLTVTTTIYRNGVSILAGQAVTEVGGGLYAYVLAAGSVTVEGEYISSFDNATWGVINAIAEAGLGGVENLDASISGVMTAIAALPSAAAIATAVWSAGTRTLTTFGTLVADIWAYATRTLTAFNFGSSVTVQSPVAASGDITLFAGDDYASADSRAVVFTFNSPPDLTGSTPRLKAGWITKTGVVTLPGTVTFEFTNAETAAATKNRSVYEVEITLASGRVVTLTSGYVTVVRQF